MVWDLRGALLKKGEMETARLAEFEFRLRARTFRLLAQSLDSSLDPTEIVRLITQADDDSILTELANRYPAKAAGMAAAYARWRAEARRVLVSEFGDPSPHRLA